MVDRIVDGGYFENFGAQTAVELVRAMVAIDASLAPFILIVSNDPEIPLPDDVQAPNADEASFLTDLSGPVNAIMNSRAARGTLAADGVDRALQFILTTDCKLYSAHIRVWPEFIQAHNVKDMPKLDKLVAESWCHGGKFWTVIDGKTSLVLYPSPTLGRYGSKESLGIPG